MNHGRGTGSRTRGLHMKNVLLIAALLAAFAAPSAIRADTLSESQKEALQREAIPSYPGASFTTSDEGEALTVLWFKSTDPPAKIMTWYGEHLSTWSRIETNGATVLYKGPPGLEATELSDKPYIFTRSTTESEPVASEITIRLPRN